MKEVLAFPFNLNPCRLAIRLVSAVLILASVSSPAAQPGSVVTIDTNLVLSINGRKVFTIGFSAGPPINGVTPTGKDALQELRDAGALVYRMNQTTDWSNSLINQQQAILDWAAQHDMYVWVHLRELSSFAAGDTVTSNALLNIVNTFKNHPAVGMWKNADEAWWSGVSAADLKRGYDVIKQGDTNHPVVQINAPRGAVADLQPYAPATDIEGVDIYPVTASGTASNPPITNTAISQVGDWTRELAQVCDGQKEYWMTEQIAFSGTTPPAHTLVFPTFTQSRFMAYQAIVNGARGLLFYGGNIAATLNAQDTPLGWNWTFWNDVLKPVVQQLGDKSLLADALVAPGSNLPITMSGTVDPDVEFCVREAGAFIYILATKREGATVNVTFSGLPSEAGLGDVLYEAPRTVSAHNGQFTDTFAPLDVHVYRFAPTNQPPTISSQPQSRTNNIGTTASFSVTATGAAPLSYQWRKNGSSLADGSSVSGATTNTLTLSSVQSADAGSYSVVVSNNTGSITSSLATLTVPAAIVIVTHPASRTNDAGTSAAFSVSVTGSNPQFQWRKNGANLGDGSNVSGATTATLTLANVLKADAAAYTVVVTNQFNSLTSLNATLDVIDPAVTNQPLGQIVPLGGTVVFSVGAAGTPSLSYRWKKGGLDLSNAGNVSGAASATLTITNVQSGDVGSYSVAVSNSVGFAFSATVALTLTPAPVITDQPDSRTNNAGTIASFSVGANGSGLTYRWLRSGTNLSNAGNISGATTPTLTLSSVFSADAANYSVIVSNAAGSVTSATAWLSVAFPMPYYEPFSYPVGANLGGQTNFSFLTWSDVGTSTGGPYVTNVTGNLTYSGLPVSTGNSVRFGGLGKSGRFSFAPGNTYTDGTVYYSFLFKVIDSTGLDSTGIFIAGFNNTMGTQANQPSVIGTRLYIRSATGGFNLGVSKNSSTTTDWVWDSRVFTNNQVIFVVGGYTLNPTNSDDVTTLWINPSSAAFGSAVAPAPSLTATNGSDISPLPLASFVLFQRSASEPAGMIADELRIAQTWAGVTAVAAPMAVTLTSVTRLANGAVQFAYTDATFQSGTVYASTNLTNWASLGAATLVSPGLYQFTDTAATNYPRRFYQLRSQ